MDTRSQILQEVFGDMVIHGFQGTRPDKVIRNLGITKGALYHYFPNKKELGYSVVEEVLQPMYLEHWFHLAEENDHPVDQIKQALKKLELEYTGDSVALGCPLNNLIQEMSPLDEGFRKRLEMVVKKIHELIQNALERGKRNHQIREKVDPERTAHFIFASIEGSYSMAKVRNNKKVFHASMQTLSEYLESLKR